MIALRKRPTNRALSVSLAVGFLSFGPVAAIAQEAVQTPKTHTVKKGDTLWDLAALYLGDAFRWPDLYRLNTDVVEDPHWIYPGEILKLPGYTGTDLPGMAQPGRDTAGVVPPTVVAIDTMPRPLTPTTFGRNRGEQQVVVVDTMARPIMPSDTARPAPAVRYGDFVRAPWIDRLKGPPVWGRIIGAADLPGIEAARMRGRFQLNDRVLIAPPAGSVAPEGELYLAYHYGPLVEEVGQVIVPTGVVEVLRSPVNGEAAIARVSRMFREVSESDRLMPYDSSVVAITGTPTAVKNGAEGGIRWVADDPVLPSPTYYMVLSLTSSDVQPGDHVELFQPRQKAKEEGQYAIPEIKVGRAQIIKATPYGATAMVTRLDQPKIDAKSTKVRVVAKMQ